ncbi:DUF799 domain-containing protein [Salinimonas lutimaris]|uniref:DUF799 domain-containing protein n=1 Tax=Salinimonas lutimaris TaxID=914153 RepID=UPI0010BFB0B0
MNRLKQGVVMFIAFALSACASQQATYDDSAFKQSDPASILILPPVNNTPEIIAPYSVMAQAATPLAESGFYVFPVGLVDQTFKNNGLTVAQDIQAVPVAKLQEIFGADAALYITIERYGTSYVVVSSETRVTLSASLVDLQNGQQIWQGTATASSAENQANVNNSLVGLLIQAAVSQVFETVTDRGFDISALATSRLLSAKNKQGLRYGPRSPEYRQEEAQHGQ